MRREGYDYFVKVGRYIVLSTCYITTGKFGVAKTHDNEIFLLARHFLEILTQDNKLCLNETVSLIFSFGSQEVKDYFTQGMAPKIRLHEASNENPTGQKQTAIQLYTFINFYS